MNRLSHKSIHLNYWSEILRPPLIAEGLIDFERYLLNSSLDSLAYDMKNRDAWDQRHNTINLKILTILTACRAYHDQRKHLLNETTLSNETKQAVEIEFRNAFDSSFEYRLMETLRNYAQHRKLPLAGVTESNKNEWADESTAPNGPSRLRFTLNPYFSRKALLKERKAMRSATMDDLEKIEQEQLDVKYLLRKYVSDLSNCHFSFRELSQNVVAESHKQLLHASAFLAEAKKSNDGTPPRHITLSHRYNQVTDNTYADIELSERLTNSRKSWGNLKYFMRMYYSSQLVADKNRHFGEGHTIWIPS
ncbi:MAG: hypothetical protein COA53_12670 [Rhodobacteraceae bacterium]|nr:MAG: hypothetical protein COA53_12670 [Paracoccaceae bacterium]